MYEGIENVFDKRYKIMNILGKGGMGSVYLAKTNDRLEQKRAIKEIDCKMTVGQDVLHEAFILKELEHDGIPRIIEIKEYKEKIYIVQEYIEGKSLQEIIGEKKQIEDKVIFEWLKKLVEILNYIHNKKIIHRDIKPHNIMLTKEGKIKLIDFGIATNNTILVENGYTPIYAAPEQINKGYTDKRSDIYSLGVTLCYLLIGETPKTNKDKTEYIYYPLLNKEKLMPGLIHIIKKSTDLSPSKRYKNTDEIKRDIERIKKFDRKYKRQRWLADIKIGLILLIFIISTICIVGGMKQLELEKQEKYIEICKVNFELVSNSKRYEQAKLGFEEAIHLLSEELEAYRGIAKIYYLKYEYDQCIEYVKSVFSRLVDASNDEELNYLIGTAYFEKKDYNEATYYLERAYKLNPNEEKYGRDLAVSYARNGNLDAGETILSEMKNNGFTQGVTYYVTGEIEKAKGNYISAYTYFEQSLSETKGEEVKNKAYISLANLLKDNPNVFEDANKKAIQILQQAQNTLKDKNNIVLVEMLGEAYFNYANKINDDVVKNEMLTNSVNMFEQLISLGYERSYIYRNIAIIYQQLRYYSNAENTLLKMIDVYPDNYQGQLQLVWLYLQVESEREIEERDYNKVVEEFNKLVDTYEMDNIPEYLALKEKMLELVEKRWIIREELNI